MPIKLYKGDIIDLERDVLVASANVQLNLSGGVGAAMLQKGGVGIQEECYKALQEQGKKVAKPGEVYVTSAGSLKAKHIIHAVAIDAFYDSNEGIIRTATRNSLDKALELNAMTIALPALATGYGRFPVEKCAEFMVDEALKHFKVGITFSLCNNEAYEAFKRELKGK